MGRVILSLALAVFGVSTASAQDVAPPHRMTVVAPRTVAVAPTPAKRPISAAAVARLSLARPAGSSGGLASQCRTRCAETRYTCLVDDAGSGGQCDSRWSQCAAGCAGSGYLPTSAYARSLP